MLRQSRLASPREAALGAEDIPAACWSCETVVCLHRSTRARRPATRAAVSETKTLAVFAAAIQRRLREPRSSLRALRAPAAGLPCPPPSLARSLVEGPSGGRLGRTHGLRRTAAAGPRPASPGAPDAACLGQGDGLGRNWPKASSVSLHAPRSCEARACVNSKHNARARENE